MDNGMGRLEVIIRAFLVLLVVGIIIGIAIKSGLFDFLP